MKRREGFGPPDTLSEVIDGARQTPRSDAISGITVYYESVRTEFP